VGETGVIRYNKVKEFNVDLKLSVVSLI